MDGHGLTRAASKLVRRGRPAWGSDRGTVSTDGYQMRMGHRGGETGNEIGVSASRLQRRGRGGEV